MGLLTGKNGIIVGASQGIGLGIAKKFVEEGGNIIMTARGKDKLDKACAEVNALGHEGRAVAMTAYAASSSDAEKVFRACVEQFGKVDFLVNNAAIGEMQTLETVTDERIDDILRTNIKGPMVYCREALKYMIDQNSGAIVNVSSINGIRPLCGIAYSSSKGGVNTFTEALAIYLVGIGANVRVNALCPGFTYSPTSLNHDVVPHTLRDGMMNAIRDARSVRRDDVRATPEEQANAALFLVSDLSSAVTGITLKTDHGSYL